MQAIFQCQQRRKEVESTSRVTLMSPLAILGNGMNKSGGSRTQSLQPEAAQQSEILGTGRKIWGCSHRWESPLPGVLTWNLWAWEVTRGCDDDLVCSKSCSLCAHAPNPSPLPSPLGQHFSHAGAVPERPWIISDGQNNLQQDTCQQFGNFGNKL